MLTQIENYIIHQVSFENLKTYLKLSEEDLVTILNATYPIYKETQNYDYLSHLLQEKHLIDTRIALDKSVQEGNEKSIIFANQVYNDMMTKLDKDKLQIKRQEIEISSEQNQNFSSLMLAFVSNASGKYQETFNPDNIIDNQIDLDELPYNEEE